MWNLLFLPALCWGLTLTLVLMCSPPLITSDSEDDFTDKKLGIDTWKQKKQEVKGVHAKVRSHKAFCPHTCDAYTRSYGVQQGSPVAFSPDGNYSAFVSSSFSIYVKSLFVGGKDIVLNGHRARVCALLFHPTRKLLVSAGEEGVFVWDLATGGTIIQRLSTQQSRRMHRSPVDSVCWGYNGRILFTGSNDSTIIIFLLTERNVLQFIEQIAAHKAAVRALVYNQHTHRLASSGRDSVIRIWDVSGLDILLSSDGASEALVARSPSANTEPTAAGGAAGDATVGASIYDVSPTAPDVVKKSTVTDQTAAESLKSTVNKFSLLWSMEGHRGDVLELDFIRNGRFIVSGARDNSMKVWDTSTGLYVRDVDVKNGHTGDVEVLKTLDSENMIILTGSGDGSLKIWRLGNSLISLEQAPDTSHVFNTTDEDLLRDDDDDDHHHGVVGAIDGMQDTRNDAQQHQQRDPLYHDQVLFTHSLHGTYGISCVALNPVYPMVISSSLACEIRIWNTSNYNNFQLINQFIGHQSAVADCLVFKSDFGTKSNPTALSSLSIGADASMLQYDINNVLVEGYLQLPFAPRQVLITSDGRFAFVCGNGYDTLVYEVTYVEPQPIRLASSGPSNIQLILDALSLYTKHGEDGADGADDELVAGGAKPAAPNASSTTLAGAATTTSGAGSVLPPLVTSSMVARFSSKPIAKLTGHCGRIFSIAIDDNHTVLASGSQDFHVNLYDLRMLYQLFPKSSTVSTHQQQPSRASEYDTPLMHPPASGSVPTGASGAANRTAALSDSDSYVGFSVYDDPSLIPLKPVARFQPASGHIHSLAFRSGTSQGNLLLAAGLADRSLHIFTITPSQRPLDPHSSYSPSTTVWGGSWFSAHQENPSSHTGVISTVIWSHNPQDEELYLYSSGWDKTVVKWAYTKNGGLRKVKAAGSPTATDRPGNMVKGHSSKINDLCLSEDGKYLMTASSDQSCILWSAADLTPLVSYATPTNDGGMTAIQSQRNVVIVGTEHGMLFEYPLFNPELHATPSDGNPFKVNSSSQSRR